MHTPTLLSTAFTAAALIAGASGQPIRRDSFTEERSPSAPPSRRGSIVPEELAGSRRASIVDLPSTPVRRDSVADNIIASRRGSLPSPEKASNSRRSSLAGPGDIAASRRRSLAVPDESYSFPGKRNVPASPVDIVQARRRSAVEDLPPARRSSLAGPSDILAARSRGSVDEPQQAVKRSSLSPNDIFAARSRGSTDEGQQFARRSSLSPNDIVASRRRSVADLPRLEIPKRSEGLASPIDNSSARRRSVFENAEAIASRTNLAGPADIVSARRRSVVESAAEPEKRSESFASPVDIAAARKRSVSAETPNDVSRRDIVASPVDIMSSRRRSVFSPESPVMDGSPSKRSSLAVPADIVAARKRALGSSTPSRRSSLANELPIWRTSFGAGAVEGDVVVEEEIAPEDGPSSPGGTSVPLFKREANPLTAEGGEVDIQAAVAHLDKIQIKYEKGIIAHQTNEGVPIFDAKLYTPDELYEREFNLAARAENNDNAGTSHDDEQTIEEKFMEGASEFSVGNPNLARRGGNGGVSLSSYNSDLRSVKIGSNGQSFVLDFDTGSADTWVPSASCSTDACSQHNKYDPTASSSSDLVDNNKLYIKYGDGSSTSGTVYTDDVTVGGLTAKDQTIGVATTLSSDFKNDPQDGIMGMAFQSISQMNAQPFFQTLMKQSKVNKSQVSFSLKSGQGSELYLGGANPAKYTGEQEWHNIVSESYWVITGDAFVNGQSASSDFYAIVDTGTTVIVAPPEQAQAFWAQVPGSKLYQGGYYTFPCDSVPSVSFSFGGKKWPMSQSNINLGSTASGSDQCVGSIVGMDVGVSAWIIGDAFLKDVYTTFDFDEKKVGFAQKA